MVGIRTSVPLLAGGLLALHFVAACAPQAPLPSPRSVIVYSGERIHTDGERMRDVEAWLQPQLDDIDYSPDFTIEIEPRPTPAYPWDTLQLEGDTVTIELERAATDARTPHLIYAHYRLMAERGRLHEWLPDLEEGEELDPFEAELRILARVSDVWLLGRSVFDTHAYGPLDELLYANERGKLTEFVLATQGERFPEARERHTRENPGWEEDLRAFFRTTFEREGPGYLPEEPAGADAQPAGSSERLRPGSAAR